MRLPPMKPPAPVTTISLSSLLSATWCCSLTDKVIAHNGSSAPGWRQSKSYPFRLTQPMSRLWDAPDARAYQSEVGDEEVAAQWNEHGVGHAASVFEDQAHQGGEDSAADDGHHDQGASQLGVGAEFLQAQREDGREHERHEEARKEDGP